MLLSLISSSAENLWWLECSTVLYFCLNCFLYFFVLFIFALKFVIEVYRRKNPLDTIFYRCDIKAICEQKISTKWIIKERFKAKEKLHLQMKLKEYTMGIWLNLPKMIRNTQQNNKKSIDIRISPLNSNDYNLRHIL